MAFQGSRSAEHRHLNPVRVEKNNKKKKKENPANPIELHGVFSTPLNFRLVNKKGANNQVCLSYWTPNNSGGHSPNEGTIVLKYVYTEGKTNRTFVYTKDGTKYFLAKANAYFNPNFKSASDPFELTKMLTCLTD